MQTERQNQRKLATKIKSADKKEIVKKNVLLEEFLIQAITKGSDDIGKVHMQLKHNSKIYYGFFGNDQCACANIYYNHGCV